MDKSNNETSNTQPDDLLCQCMRICVKHPSESLLGNPPAGDGESAMEIDMDSEVQSTTDACHNKIQLKTPAFIPDNICEGLFQQIIKEYPEQYLNLFVDTTKCRLSKIDLSTTKTKYPVSNGELYSKLFFHPLQEINLSGCKLLPNTILSLKHCAPTLRILELSSTTGIAFSGAVLKELTQLQKLNLQNTDIGYSRQNMKYIASLKKLKWLDLSCTNVDDQGLEELMPLSSSLVWLSLYNCQHVGNEDTMLRVLPHFKQLIHLDLSKIDRAGPVVTTSVIEVCSRLPDLKSLDISGTMGLTEQHLEVLGTRPQPFKFLGLASTGLSFHRNLPAEKVTGEHTEEQLLNSLEIYKNRQKYVSIALRKLFTLARLQTCDDIRRCLELLIQSMQNFSDSDSINIAATASIYHLSREEKHPANKDPKLRRKLVEVILNSMSDLKGVLQLQKNCCLTLCNFKIPMELEFALFRVAYLLLAALRNHKDDYLRRIAIMVFNTIVCQNLENQKREIGYLGAVKTILHIIEEKIETGESDQLLETCWSSLWNMTDETPENCRDFLDNGGMAMFVKSLELYPNSLELHRNIMGLMGNVGEVQELRCRLMNSEYINIFMNLLSDDPSRLEVSYNSSGLLSHILSDGEDAWTIKDISRNECMLKIVECIDKWDLSAQRNINYRSFKPILCLLVSESAPAAQHWAIWALANLTKVYPLKYCKLVEEEGGLDLIRHMLSQQNIYKRTEELGKMVVEQCINVNKYDSMDL